MKNSKGQIQIANIIGWAIAIALATSGSYFASLRLNESRIIELDTKQQTENIVIVQRVSKLEEAVETIKDDNKVIKADIKEILRLLR